MSVKIKKGKGILFDAVPDSGQVMVKVAPHGRPLYIWPNRLGFPESLLPKIKKQSVPFLYPPQTPVEYKGGSWIVNMCADADEYRNALIGLDRAFGDKIPIFNHPRAVAMTRRDLSAKRLAGIPNLVVPKCVRFMADENNSFQRAFEANGFNYPVLVRPAKSQTGRDLVKIDNPFDWPKVYKTHWQGKSHFMTQYVDYSNTSGDFIKSRIVYVGERMFVRHVKRAENWRIHNQTASSKTADEAWEASISEQLMSDPVFHNMLSEVPVRVKLDFFGLDIGVDLENRRAILFEANAAMSIFFATGADERSQARATRLQHPIVRALEEHFATPKNWRSGADIGEEPVERIFQS
ncbi:MULTISPECIES: hypothetical protein [Roseobacteraceae]|uniref:hypothetical protein n=1 Tax=Roseobacteraceae TaxID=2854170 RepID=UPI00125FBB29|nr:MULTISPECIES: hypothetical protein [Roseobacteraceae]KAB6718157.1 hypothetical protein C8029_00235 [Roseobacter sp. TSBP12]|tara:strand:+ start:1639 stop:2688 length:1050 start_codon:yes stop_codon:yes gene_type:complete